MGPLDSAAKVILREVPKDLVALAPALAGRRVLSAQPDDTVLPAFSLTIPGQQPLVPYAGGATEGHVEQAFEALDRVRPEERRGELQAALVAFAENVFPDQNWAARVPKGPYMGSTIYQLGEEAGFQLGALKSLRRALAIMCEREWGIEAASLSRRAEAADLETLEVATSLFAQGLGGHELWQQLDSLLPTLADSPPD